MSDSTEPIYRLRIVEDENGSWVFRDELVGGVCVARQQLQPDGWWSVAWEVEPEFWAGDPDEPTVTPEKRFNRAPKIGGSPLLSALSAGISTTAPVYPSYPPMPTSGGTYTASTRPIHSHVWDSSSTIPAGTVITDTDGRVWTSDGRGDWSTPGGPTGSIVSSSPPPADGKAVFTPDMMDSIYKAINKTGSMMTVSPAVQKMLDSKKNAALEHAVEEEKAFIFGTDKRRKKKPPK